MNNSRYISKKKIQIILNRQQNKCANGPDVELWRLENYICPLWRHNNGTFDNAGYEIDHVVEHSKTHDNDIDNLQALCPMCHTVKTKDFQRESTNFQEKSYQFIHKDLNKKSDMILIDNLLAHINHNNKNDLFVEMMNESSIEDDSLIDDNSDNINTARPRFICDKCGYPTNIKSHYDAHIAANSCKEGKLNSRVKNVYTLESNTVTNDSGKKTFDCPICNKSFPRKFNRDRHYNEIHLDKINNKDGHDNVITKTTQCHNPINSHDTNSHNLNTRNNCNFVSSPPMHNHFHYNINDLTLFGQYLVFYCHITQCSNIYKTLIDLLDFNPNGLEYNYIKSNYMRVFDRNIWILQTAGAIEHIIETRQSLVYFIYNKFRIFISHRLIIYDIKRHYNSLFISDKYKELYNKTKYNDTLPIDENVLFESDHEIWNALSKSFTWKDVVFYIDKLESINVDFSHNLSKIRDHITDYLELHPEESPIYELLIHKINILANEYLYDKEDYSSSDSDEIDNHIRRSEVSSSKYHIRVGKREVNPAKYAKKYEEQQKEMNKKDSKVKLDDHKTMAKKVNYYGSKKIGMPYLSETTSD